MPAKDPTFARGVLDQSFRDDAYTPPTDYEIVLTTDVPTATTDGTEVSTGSWTNYARQTVPNDATNWGPAATTSGISSTWNLNDIDFGAASVSGTAPVIRGVEVWASGGGRVYYGALATPIQVLNTLTPRFLAGTLVIREN